MNNVFTSFEFGDWNVSLCPTGIVTSHFPCTEGNIKSSVSLDRFGVLQCMFCNSFIPEDIKIARKFIEEAFFNSEYAKEYKMKIFSILNAMENNK